MRVRKVNNNAETRFSKIFAKTNKSSRTVFVCSYGAYRSNILRQKNGQKSRDTAPLIIIIVVYCLLSMVKNRINDRITNLITLMPKLLVITPNGMGLYIVHAVQQHKRWDACKLYVCSFLFLLFLHFLHFKQRWEFAHFFFAHTLIAHSLRRSFAHRSVAHFSQIT